MKKKVLSILLTIFVIFTVMSALGVSASAANIGTVTGVLQDTSDPTNNAIEWAFTYNRYEGTATLTLSGNGYMPNATYAESWLPVQNEVQCYVTRLVVKDGVKSIMENAFLGEIYLEEVTLPDSIESIGEGAFAYTSIEKMYIPQRLEYVNSLMFIGSPIKEYTVSNYNENYRSNGGFIYSKDMTELVVAPAGKWIDNSNYAYTIPSSVTSIAPYAFYGVNINSINIPSNVRIIRQMAFSGSSLSRVTFQNGIQMLYDSVFMDCKNLKQVHLPSSLTYVGMYTFGYYYKINYTAAQAVLDDAGINYKPLDEDNIQYYLDTIGYTVDQFMEPVANTSFLFYAPDNSAGAKYAQNNGMKRIRSQALTPVATSAVSSNGGMLVKWTFSSDATGYYVYRKNLNNVWERIAIVRGGGTTSYVDAGAYAGRTNIYTVRAYNASGQSYCYQSGVSGFYVPAPKLTSIANNVNGIRINWAKQSGITQYNIYRKTSSQISWQYLTSVPGSATYYVDTSVKSNSRYSYTVMASIKTANSAYNNTGLSVIFVDDPAFSVYNITNGIAVKWSHGYYADSFRIYRKTNGGSWQLIKVADGKDTVYYDKAVTRGTSYTYTVRAVYNSSLSCYYPAGKTLVSIDAPLTVKVQNRVSGAMVTWNRASGAQGYHIYRRVAGGNWVRIATVKGIGTLQYLDTKAQSGTQYYYTVRAYNGSSLSTYNTNGTALTFVATPRLISAKSVKAGVTVTYSKSANCDGYYVYRKTAGSSWVRIATVNGADKVSYTDRGAVKGTTYIYTVKAYKGSVMSSYFANGIEVKDIY